MKLRILGSTLLLVLSLGFTNNAPAQILSETFSHTTSAPGATVDNFSFPVFDSTLGTLNAITVSVVTSTNINISYLDNVGYAQGINVIMLITTKGGGLYGNYQTRASLPGISLSPDPPMVLPKIVTLNAPLNEEFEYSADTTPLGSTASVDPNNFSLWEGMSGETISADYYTGILSVAVTTDTNASVLLSIKRTAISSVEYDYTAYAAPEPSGWRSKVYPYLELVSDWLFMV